MIKIKPKDVLAALVIVSFGALRWHGIDNGFDTPVAIIIAYYFVKRQNGEDNGH